MTTTGWKYAEYEGNTYRWPDNGDIIKMERWDGDSGAWGEMLLALTSGPRSRSSASSCRLRNTSSQRPAARTLLSDH